MKSLIRNALGDKILNTYVPMTPTNANTFATDMLEGTWSIYEAGAETGTDVATSAIDVTCQVRNSGTGKKAYLRFIAKANKNGDEIQTVLTGLTVDGILIDEVVIISLRPLTFA